MKEQYIAGTAMKKFIRMHDMSYTIGCSLTLEEAKEAKKIMGKKCKIYKLVEVKK